MWIKQLAINKDARFNYFLEEIFEAGLVLAGSEVKSCKSGKVSIREAYCKISESELFMFNMNILPYDKGVQYYQLEPKRKRKLLLHKREINRLKKKTLERGYSIIPTKIYIKNGLIKVEIALGKGKQKSDKRKLIVERDVKRDLDRAIKNRRD